MSANNAHLASGMEREKEREDGEPNLFYYYTDSETSLYTAPHRNNNIRLDLETL